MSFLRGFSIIMGANIIVFVLSFLYNKLLYIYLTTDENGSYFLVMRYAFLFALIFGEWLRLSNMNIAGQDHKKTKTLLNNVLSYVVTIAFIMFLVFRFLPSIITHVPGLTPHLVIFSCIVGLLLIIRDGIQSLLLVNNRMIIYGITNILWSGVMLVLIATVIIIFGKSLYGAIMVLIIASAIAAAWGLLNSIRMFGISRLPSPDLFRHAGRLGVRSIVAVTGTFMMLNIHGFVLEPLAADPEKGLFMVGLFSVGFRIFQLFQRMSDVTGSLVFSHVTQQTSNAGNLTATVHRNSLLFFCVGAVLAFVFGKYIIYIVAAEKFYDALIPFYIMLPGIICFNMGFIINSSYWGSGYPLHVILPPYAFCIIGIVMNVVLVPIWGIHGTAVSFSMTGIMWYLYILYIFHRDYHIPYNQFLFPKLSEITTYWYRIKKAMP